MKRDAWLAGQSGAGNYGAPAERPKDAVMKAAKFVLIGFVVLVMFALVLGMTARRVKDPQFSFLKGRRPAIVDTQVDPVTGASRRVLIYRFTEPYSSLVQRCRPEVLAKAGWRLDQQGTGPNWSEYHGPSESVEFVDDEPTDFSAKTLGVSWSPTGNPATRGRSIIYTCPGDGIANLIAPIRSFFRRFGRGP